MTTGVNEYPSELDRKSLETLRNWRQELAIKEQTKRISSLDRNAMANRNNQKPMVIRRRTAVCKPNLTFCGIGTWGW